MFAGRVGEDAEQIGTGLRDGQTIDTSIWIRGPMVCMSVVTLRMKHMKRGFVIRLHDIVKLSTESSMVVWKDCWWTTHHLKLQKF